MPAHDNWDFETIRKHEEPKVTTVAGMAALRRQQTTTATRIATSRLPLPVTVGTFERFGLGRGGPYHGGRGCLRLWV